MSAEVLQELGRLFDRIQPNTIFGALRGELGLYAIDGEFTPHHHGHPRSKQPAFDDYCLLHGAQALSFLSVQLPDDAQERRRLAPLHAAMQERLQNPKLLLFGGFPNTKNIPQDPDGAYVVAGSYLYFCPVKVKTEAQREVLRAASEFSYPNQTYPWSSTFPAWEAFTSPGFSALVARSAKSDVDPRRSASAVVSEVCDKLRLEEVPATLLLQVMTLVDCDFSWLRSTDLKKASEVLLTAGHVTDKKRQRATRKISLHGEWLPLKPPHPAMERWKLPLYRAETREKGIAAPLGRLLPLQPLGALYAEAWKRFLTDAPEGAPKLTPKHDWLADIRARPDDDAPRMVYADWLIEQGDPRGELIRVQCQLTAGPHSELEAEEKALLKKHEKKWLAEVNPYVTGVKWERGFVTHVSAHAQTFLKGADVVFAQLPMLRGFIFDAGAPGPVTPAQARELGASPVFARFTELDTSADHYFSQLDHLLFLLESKHLPKLKRLRIGFHRPGDGLSRELARALAACERLHESLQFLELAGQNLGRGPFDGKPFGIEALETLLGALRGLQTLRIPYNGFGDREAYALAKRLASDSKFAPSLREVDWSNTIDTSPPGLPPAGGTLFVTKAVTFFRNRVTPAGAHAVAEALAKRRGQTLGPAPKAELPKAEKLEQKGKFPFAALAKTGSSRCVVCRKLIKAETVRVGVERMLPDVGRITAWLHPQCRTDCPELQGINDLDARLKKNSPRGLWPPSPKS